MAKQTVLVTGASSFVGAHLVTTLAGLGYRVLAGRSRARDEYEGIQERRLRQIERHDVETLEIDVRDPDAVRSSILRHRPSICFHHAGWVQDYGAHEYDLAKGHAVHAGPLPAVIRALRDVGAAGLVLTGTSAEYSPSGVPNREDEACYPSMPYGLSKLEATIRARQLALRFGINVRVARVFIPFGPLDAPGKLVPQVVTALMQRQPVELSAGTQRRDFIHIDDLIDGYVRLLATLDQPQPFLLYNLCGGDPCAVKGLLTEIARCIGADESLLRFGARAMREGEMPFSCGDNRKAREDLGFAPRNMPKAVADYVASLTRTPEPGCA